jgi:hypothetical protein
LFEGDSFKKIISVFMTYHQIFSTKKMTDATSGAGTAHSSGAPHRDLMGNFINNGPQILKLIVKEFEYIMY